MNTPIDVRLSSAPLRPFPGQVPEMILASPPCQQLATRPMPKSPASPARRKAFPVPNILESLRADCAAGTLSIAEAADELSRAGWMPGTDIAKAKRLLRLP